jgi:hypothetical protein
MRFDKNCLVKIEILGGAIGFVVLAGLFLIPDHQHDGHKGMFEAHHGADGKGHDEVNMPGLQGKDTTEDEVSELAEMFRKFEKITRSVENLPNGIRTVTHSDDPALFDVVTSHVGGMLDRVGDGRNPEVIIQSPTLDIIFERGSAIVTDVEITEDGLIVTQTSADAEVVAALQTHAAEVTAMADRGMAAVHEMMMKRGDSH